MNILILGSGGREHALAWKIHSSPYCDKLFVAPGNAGTEQMATNLDLNPENFESVESIIRLKDVGLVVVGPEVPLVKGIADYLHTKFPKLLIVGPESEGAQLEGSKAFAKEFMVEYQIPTAGYIEVSEGQLDKGLSYIRTHQGPYVLKADGLAAGKGVLIIDDKDEAERELKKMLAGKFGLSSKKVVIEEFLKGIEFSVFILTDGNDYVLLPVAKDYKRIGVGDTGLNTGGMGTVSPVAFADGELMRKVEEKIVRRTMQGLKKRKIRYTGFLFFGLINVNGDPYVIEYNCRLGDPETQVIIPRIQNDLVELFLAMRDHRLNDFDLLEDSRHAVAVVLVSGGYPGSYEKGKLITGLDNDRKSLIFHAGTKRTADGVITNGGRVLAVTSLSASMRGAIDQSMHEATTLSFEGKYYRSDIGLDLY